MVSISRLIHTGTGTDYTIHIHIDYRIIQAERKSPADQCGRSGFQSRFLNDSK